MSVVVTDPIADLLARIRNALAVHQTEVSIPHSKLKEQLLKLLKSHGFITGYRRDKDGYRNLVVELVETGSPVMITGLARISKPGRRVYVSATDIPRVMGGRGLVVVS